MIEVIVLSYFVGILWALLTGQLNSQFDEDDEFR